MVTQNLRFLSGINGFLPESTGQVIAHIRKPEQFAINRYTQYVPAPQPLGVYAMIGRDEAIRVVSDAEFTFEDGDEAPQGQYNQIPFTWQEFRCYRRAYPWRLGYQAIETADRGKAFKPKVAHMAMAVSKALTNRTNRVATLLTGANWGTHDNTANTLNGGAGGWATASDDPASPFYQAIWKTISAALQAIHLDTNGNVKAGNVRCIVGPTDAIKMSQAPEIINFVRQTPDAVRLVEGGFDPQWMLWGLPRHYKGIEFVVEDTPIVDVRPNVATISATAPLHPAEAALATPGRHYVWPTGTAVLCSRIGALDGEYGAPSFSTMQVFHYGGLLEVRAFDDPRNERVIGRCQENIHEQIVSNVSGYRITSI